MTRTLGILWIFVLAAGLAACDQDDGGYPAWDTTTDTGVPDTSGDTAVDPTDDTVVDTTTDSPPPDTVEDPGTDTSGFDGVPGEFTQSYDSRSYRMYVPDSYSHSVAIPVVLGFHGAGDSGANFYAVSSGLGWTAAASSAPFILIVPDTKSPYSDFAVWSGNPMDDLDEMSVEMNNVLDLVADVGTHYNIDEDNIYAYGFSDGGLFLGVTGFEYASDFAGLAITGYGWGSFYINDPSWLIDVFMTTGTSDSFYSYAEQTQSFLTSQGHPVNWVPVSGAGHSFSSLMSTSPPSTIYTWMATH